ILSARQQRIPLRSASEGISSHWKTRQVGPSFGPMSPRRYLDDLTASGCRAWGGPAVPGASAEFGIHAGNTRPARGVQVRKGTAGRGPELSAAWTDESESDHRLFLTRLAGWSMLLPGRAWKQMVVMLPVACECCSGVTVGNWGSRWEWCPVRVCSCS